MMPQTYILFNFKTVESGTFRQNFTSVYCVIGLPHLRLCLFEMLHII